MVYLQIEVINKGGYTDSWRPAGDTPHSNVGWRIQSEEEGIQFSESSSG